MSKTLDKLKGAERERIKAEAEVARRAREREQAEELQPISGEPLELKLERQIHSLPRS